MRRVQVARAWRRVVPGIAAAAVVLGMTDFAPADGFLGAALKTLQLFVINVGPAELAKAGPAGWLAAGLAPLATAGAAIYAFGERAWHAWEALQLRLRPADDVFIGGGEVATGVAARRARMLAAAAGAGGARGKLVGIDLREDAPLARAMPELGVDGFVRAGDALSEGALRQLLPGRAANVWVLAGDDHRNLEIARRVREGIEASAPSGRRSPVRVLVDVRERQLLRAADALYAEVQGRRTVIDFFSLPRLAARTLLREHPPRRGGGPGGAHLLVIGAGELAAALVVHAAQHCVLDEDPARCVRITIVGRGSRALHERLQREFAALAPSSDDPALACLLPLARIESLECQEREFAHADWLALQRAQPFDVVYVTGERDLDTLGAATRAAALRELTPGATAAGQPIVACLGQAAERRHSPPPAPGIELAQARDASGACELAGTRAGAPVLAFDVYARCIRDDETYPGERQDLRAMLVHAAWLLSEGARFEASEQGVREAQREWGRHRREAFRWSDRLAADHVDLKLDLLAQLAGDDALRDWRAMLAEQPQRVARAAEELLRGRPELRLALARLEHRRFLAERLLEGWLPLPAGLRGCGASGLAAGMQKELLRLNHTLVPFDRLREADAQTDQRDKDLRLVDAIPEILRGEALLRGRG